jgi:hypothetical protein
VVLVVSPVSSQTDVSAKSFLELNDALRTLGSHGTCVLQGRYLEVTIASEPVAIMADDCRTNYGFSWSSQDGPIHIPHGDAAVRTAHGATFPAATSHS